MMKKQVDIETVKKAIQEPSLAQDIIQLLLKIVIIIFAKLLFKLKLIVQMKYLSKSAL